jgi:hypothetical protein
VDCRFLWEFSSSSSSVGSLVHCIYLRHAVMKTFEFPYIRSVMAGSIDFNHRKQIIIIVIIIITRN